MSVESTNVLELRERIIKRIEESKEELSAVDRVLSILGINIQQQNGDSYIDNSASTTGDEHLISTIRRLNAEGTPLLEILAEIARHNGNVLNCRDAAHLLFENRIGGYANATSTYSGFYRYVVKDSRFVKTAPGVFAFRESGYQKPAQRLVNGNGVHRYGGHNPAPAAVGRNHSLCELPERFRNFNLKSLRGKTYKEAAILVAKHAGGTFKMSDLGKVFWHADLAPSAKRPGDVGRYVHASLGDTFEQVGVGTYRLV